MIAPRMKPYPFVLASVFVFIFILYGIWVPAAARGYVISAEIEGGTIGGNGIFYMFWERNGPTGLSNHLTDRGPAGNFVDGFFDVNLATGQIKTYTESYGPVYNLSAWSGNLRVKSTMQDMLFFRISKGTYNGGLWVTLHGRISGTILSEGDPRYNEAVQSAGVSFGGVVYQTGFRYSSFSDPFSVSYMLVKPGESFSSDIIRTAIVEAAGEGYSKMWSNEGGRALADFGNTISITSLEFPGEIAGWYSDSGVFLSHPVPLPSVLLLLCSGLAVLLAMRRKYHGIT